MNKEHITYSNVFNLLPVQKYKVNEILKMNTYINLFYTERVNGVLMSLFFNRCNLSKEDKKYKVL